MEESRKEDLSRWIRMAIEDKRGWCDMEIKELGDDVDKVTVLTGFFLIYVLLEEVILMPLVD